MKRYLCTSQYCYLNGKVREYAAEKWPAAVIVEEISLPNASGGETPNPGIVLWDNTGKFPSPWFAMFRRPVDIMQDKWQWIVTGLKPDWSPVVRAIEVPISPEVTHYVISRFNHDYVEHPETGHMIDGGREVYGRIGGNPLPKLVQVDLLKMEAIDGERSWKLDDRIFFNSGRH